jgi:citrate synthase
VCHLDAERERLTYRGYDVLELARHATFEDTAFLLVRGELPSARDRRAFLREWRGARKLTAQDRKVLTLAPPDAEELAVLRTAISAMGLSNGREDPVALLARTPMLVAERLRVRRGGAAVSPGRDGVAAGLLRVGTGHDAPTGLVRALDGALTLRADNELNPGTFVARVAASTGADLASCIVAALGALAGPRHSGHTLAVAHMLESVGHPSRAAGFAASLAGRSTTPAGFGHPVYRADPRTALARALAEQAAAAGGKPELFDLARAVEAAVEEQASLSANVDYYLTVIYLAAGLPPHAFAPLFAVARMPGWIAHILEQREDPALIRPRAVYAGPPARGYPLRPSRRAAARAVT